MRVCDWSHRGPRYSPEVVCVPVVRQVEITEKGHSCIVCGAFLTPLSQIYFCSRAV
ncbi:hypothetical protein M378DRAFT_169754 [Amanita muscaria Koide BX008]|uniref:Uncharacterized protein n=1 Tax=Amanita muscaria (strain Koide BX008) TaxID=946122 RepID=A0A0C2WS19_AMAMK|nr:hypothetical protein M378DRAFT_169754 [Amanita muscaria Koide BX008]